MLSAFSTIWGFFGNSANSALMMGLALTVIILAIAVYQYNDGLKEEKQANQINEDEGVISDARQVKQIADSACNDDYSRRVRDEFTKQ